ncbi:DUF4397 domain-containing protein [Alteromonas sp. C1M14]|uniref:DUF4397 domain-containing protein n=1 Tax=Alteromonas sp. C1M14 TaxID=2841567 RepID=UPI001C0A0943|nr:DUF4397 domain-containing protein [Alteromonas sp. C1M14]MBU2977253.1 DUF4397 domain-containing protein [Alteromonas sp. C1M14]
MVFRTLTSLMKFAAVLAVAVGLTACGSDSDSDYSYAYIQFYNASPNGSTVTMQDDDGDELGSAQFGDSTSLISTDNGDLDLEFIRTDSDDQEVLLHEMTVKLKTGYKTLIVLSGDFDDPDWTEYQFKRESIEDDHFRLFVTSVREDQSQYDFYMSDDGDPFEAANYLGTMTYGELNELEFWDPDDDSDDFDSDEYTIYITNPGETEVLFESQTLDFDYDIEYVLAVRDLSGALNDGMSVDAILNSSYVTNITDVDADAQYRIYNSTDYDVTVTFGGEDGVDDTVFTLNAGELSDFTDIDYGDYRVTVDTEEDGIESLSNKLVTLNQGESKAIMIDLNGNKLSANSFVESDLPQSYDKTVSFVNLVDDFDDIDFYLVRNDETIDTADYYTLNMEFEESSTLVLPSDYYEVIAVYEDDNDEQILLDRTALYGFTEDENYIVTVEPADNATGYEINVLF